MWQERLRIRSARPLALGIMRFIVIPSSTQIVDILSSSTSAPSLCSAFAIAEFKTFLIMEYRLYYYIMNPALILTSLFGLYLLYQSPYLLIENYFLIKSILVFLLIIFHIYLYFLYKDFKKGYRFKKTRFYRIINEIPTVLMITVVILIFVKPDLQI